MGRMFHNRTTKYIVPRSHQSTIFRFLTSAVSKNFIAVPSSLLKNERSHQPTIQSKSIQSPQSFRHKLKRRMITEESICQQSTTYPTGGSFSGEQRRALVRLETMQQEKWCGS